MIDTNLLKWLAQRRLQHARVACGLTRQADILAAAAYLARARDFDQPALLELIAAAQAIADTIAACDPIEAMLSSA